MHRILIAVAGVALSASANAAGSGTMNKTAPQPSAKALEHRATPRSKVPQHAADRNRAKAASARPNRPASPQ